MKRNLLLFGLLLTIASNIVAQEPIAMEGKEWLHNISTDIWSRDVRMWIEGDTIVKGKECKKLYKHTKKLGEGGEETLEIGYCRQEGDKYYQNGALMFDFGLQVGDTFILGKSSPFTVEAVGDTILADGVSRKYWLLTDTYDSDYWVEGIGSLSAGIYTNYPFSDGAIRELISCSYNGRYIYKRKGVYGNEYEPIAMEGKEWTYRTQIPYKHDGLVSDVLMWIKGDTIVDGLKCKKLYTHTKELWDGGKETLEIGYCRQEGDRYYQNGRLMYDFSLQVGDVFEPLSPLMVESVGDTILSDGITRKYLLMRLGYSYDYWIEGIGSLEMGILNNDMDMAGLDINLNSCTCDGLWIYKKTEMNIEYSQHQPISTPYYDLLGRKVAHPTRGIYIKDGRKVVIK